MDILKITVGHLSETESEALKTAVDVLEEVMATAQQHNQEYNSIYHDAETAKNAIEMFIIKYVRNRTDVWFK